MSDLLEFFGLLVKRLFIAALLLAGLALGLLIAIKVLIVMTVVHFIRRLRGPRAKPAPSNVFEGEYSVVKPTSNRATMLMVLVPGKTAPDTPLV